MMFLMERDLSENLRPRKGDPCPKCGSESFAKYDDFAHWECFSFLLDGKLVQSDVCRIKGLETENAVLLKDIEAVDFLYGRRDAR